VSAEIAERLLQLCPDATQRERLTAYAKLLLERNAAVNLTGAADARAIVDHIADALTVAPFIVGPLVDVGSGGGLPGIPLAIVCGVSVTLVESVLKKARFLEEAVRALGLQGDVVATRAEQAAHEARLRERFANATARAVGTLPTVLELTLPFLALGGRAVLQRGAISNDERRAAVDASLMLGGEIVGEQPAGPGRTLLLVEKQRVTPERFPRRAGVPGKRPLCSPVGRASA